MAPCTAAPTYWSDTRGRHCCCWCCCWCAEGPGRRQQPGLLCAHSLLPEHAGVHLCAGCLSSCPTSCSAGDLLHSTAPRLLSRPPKGLQHRPVGGTLLFVPRLCVAANAVVLPAVVLVAVRRRLVRHPLLQRPALNTSWGFGLPTCLPTYLPSVPLRAPGPPNRCSLPAVAVRAHSLHARLPACHKPIPLVPPLAAAACWQSPCVPAPAGGTRGGGASERAVCLGGAAAVSLEGGFVLQRRRLGRCSSNSRFCSTRGCPHEGFRKGTRRAAALAAACCCFAPPPPQHTHTHTHTTTTTPPHHHHHHHTHPHHHHHPTPTPHHHPTHPLACSGAVTSAGVLPQVLQLSTPLQQCLAVNRWSQLVTGEVLPMLALRRIEQRARTAFQQRRTRGRQTQGQHAASQPASQRGGEQVEEAADAALGECWEHRLPWLTPLCVCSSMLWLLANVVAL